MIAEERRIWDNCWRWFPIIIANVIGKLGVGRNKSLFLRLVDDLTPFAWTLNRCVVIRVIWRENGLENTWKWNISMSKEPVLKNLRLQSGYRVTAKASAFQLPPSHQRNSGNFLTMVLIKKSVAVCDFAFQVEGASPRAWSSLNNIRAISLICSSRPLTIGPPPLVVMKASLRIDSLCRLWSFHSCRVQNRTSGKSFRSNGGDGAGIDRGPKIRAFSLCPRTEVIARPTASFSANSEILACR